MRLVKGAYWDAEIKRAQEGGLTGYPVYTRKPNTDVSYLACARQPVRRRRRRDLSAVRDAQRAHHRRDPPSGAEAVRTRYQRLHGMGTDLYAEVIGKDNLNVPCRVYAPVGTHEDLLPYLVRRLLENGANTSFVNRVVDEACRCANWSPIPAKPCAASPPFRTRASRCR